MTSKAIGATLALTLLVATSCDTQKALFGPDVAQQNSTVAPMCYGMEATIYPGSPGYGSIVANGAGGWTITGSSRSDIIVGAENDDVILGGDGADRICSGGGNDILIGENGRDWMDGEAGEDVVSYAASPAGVTVNLGNGRGSGGTAELDRMDGVENVIGSDFPDVLRGNVLANRLEGRDGADVLFGGDGNDILMGGLAADQLNGNGGDDTLDGGAGDDDLHGGADADALNGGADTDQANYRLSPGAVTVVLASGGTGNDAEGDTYQFVENVMGSGFNDVLTGDGGPNRIDGRAGDDQVNGGAGDDMLTGGDGADTLHGDADNDVLLGKAGNDQVYGDAGNDRVFGHDGDDGIFGGDDDDDLRPGPGTNTVDGGAGNDYIDTASCTDTIVNVESHNAAHCVTAGDATTTLVSAAHDDLTADGVSATTITVQVKDAAGNSLTLGGSTVVLTTTAGTLTDGATQNTTLTAIDQGDGTYTLTLTSSTSLETASISATLDGDAVTDGASVDFIAGAVDHFVVTGTDGNLIGQQASGLAFNIKIVAQDANNNIADTFTGTVSLTANPGAVALGSTTAFTAGVFASKSVTITGGNDFAITASDGTHTGTSATFTVTSNPNAVANEVGGSSAPGNDYHGAYANAVTIPDGALDLLANDNLGFPAAAVTHFGAVQCNNGSGTLNGATGAVTANAAGASLDLSAIAGCGAGSSLQVNADGTLTFTPSATYTGLFRFQYRIGNSGGTSDAQVTLAVGVRPSASNSTYVTTLLGNVPINTATSTNTLVSATGDNLSFSVTGNSNGTGAVASNKTYSFSPSAGYSGAASFTFTATNGFGTTAGATVSLTVGTPVWFIDAGASAGGDGRNGSAINCVVGTTCFDDLANEANDVIYIAGAPYTNAAALALKDGQKVIGQGTAATFAAASGLTWPADAGTPPATNGTVPAMQSSIGNVITLASGNTLRGLVLGNAQAGFSSLAGTSFGTLTVANDLSINTNTSAIGLLTGTISGDFGGVTSSGGANNISLQSVAGTTNFGGGALSGATSNNVFVDGGAGTFTYSGTLTSGGTGRPATIQNRNGGAVTLSGDISATGLGLLVQNNTGGTYTFSGGTKTLGTTTNDAVTLSTNTGATIDFPNGGLAITTTSGRGFRASGGGTVSVGTGGSNNTVSIGTGESALWLTNMTVGANDITFASVSGTGTTTGSPLCIQTTKGSATQTINVGTLSIAGTAGGPGVCVEYSSAPVTITSATINNTAAAGIQITSDTAAVSVNGGTIGATNDPTGNVVDIDAGIGAVTIAAALTKNTAGRIAEVTGHSGGTISFSGSLNCTSSCTGINVSSNTGGTIGFSSATKTISTGANQAITLATNTGATVEFTNGGLAATTTSGTVFGASGGGTVNVSGDDNLLTTETDGTPAGGTLLTADGVSGALTFERLSGHGGSATLNGILLNNTTGLTLSITGDGTANSGGTIQNYRDRGARFVNANNISLTRMLFSGNGTVNLAAAVTCGDAKNGTNTNCAAGIDMQTVNTVSIANSRITGGAQMGINGKTVTNLTLTSLEVDNNGNETFEDGIQLVDLFGTSTWTDLNVHDNEHRQLEVQNASGTNNITVNKGAGTLFFGNAVWATTGAQGVLFSGHGTANMKMTINNATYTRNYGAAFFSDIAEGASADVTVDGGTMTDNALHFQIGSGGTYSTGTLTYALKNLTSATVDPAHAVSGPIGILKGGNTASTMTGTISGNVFGNPAVAFSGSPCISCVIIDVTNGSSDAGTHKVTISGNTFNQSGHQAIALTAGGAGTGFEDGATLWANITGNTIQNPSEAGVDQALTVNVGTGAGDTSQVCAHISGNTITGAWADAALGGRIRVRNRQPGTALRLPGFGGAFNSVTDAANFVSGQNSSVAATAQLQNGAVFTGGNPVPCFS